MTGWGCSGSGPRGARGDSKNRRTPRVRGNLKCRKNKLVYPRGHGATLLALCVRIVRQGLRALTLK